MMKKFICTLILFFSFGYTKGTITDLIPNAGFENWVFTGWTEEPEFWNTNNGNLFPPFVERDSNSHTGNIAMKLLYMNIFQPYAQCNFPLTSHPLNLGGFLKNEMSHDDSVIIVVRIYYNHALVDSGYAVYHGGIINPLYTPFIIPISTNSALADSCAILIAGAMTQTTSVSFDDLQFDMVDGIPESGKADFDYFPNPNYGRLLIKFRKDNSIPVKLFAYNMTGQMKELQMTVDNTTDDGYIVNVNTESLSKGVWLLEIRNKEGSQSFVLQKF